MVINVQFQNLSQANTEILKAFNSSNSAKALEAYQPLDTKQRKLEKLRALQILQQSSQSQTLADISLSTDSLAIALRNAEGATLQAMLNLLSAKMIEQNKYTYVDEEKQKELKEKIQRKLEEHQEQKQESKDQEKKKEEKQEEDEENNAIDKLVAAAMNYWKELSESILEKYKKVLSAFSLENLKRALNEAKNFIVYLAYEVPVEAFREYVIEPVQDFRKNLNEYITTSLKQGLKARSEKTFSSNEIKSLLQKSFGEKNNSKLESSIENLDQGVILKKKVKASKKVKLTSQDIKLALHR